MNPIRLMNQKRHEGLNQKKTRHTQGGLFYSFKVQKHWTWISMCYRFEITINQSHMWSIVHSSRHQHMDPYISETDRSLSWLIWHENVNNIQQIEISDFFHITFSLSPSVSLSFCVLWWGFDRVCFSDCDCYLFNVKLWWETPPTTLSCTKVQSRP